MKKVLILSLMLLSLSVVSIAQAKKLSDAPASFRTFFSTFRKALDRSDKAGVANMTRFPFTWGLDAGDEGKYTRTQFIRNFRRLFTDDPREVIAERNPSFGRDEDGTYYISTQDAAHLGFVKSGKTYKFVSYIVEP